MESTNKTYELRSLQAGDVFPMFTIMSKIGVKEFKDCFAADEVRAMVAENGKADASAIGAKVMLGIASVVISHIAAAEQDIYSFLAGLSGMSKDEIKTLDMVTFANMIIDVFKKDEFKDFIQVVSGLFK